MNARNAPKREIVGTEIHAATGKTLDVLSCGHKVYHRGDYKGADKAQRRACDSCLAEKGRRR